MHTFDNTYWGHNGKYQELYDILNELIPNKGEVKDIQHNKSLERLRKAANCYYDLYNNGLCNRAKEFKNVFGFGGTNINGADSRVEAKLDKIINKAWMEQKDRVLESVRSICK